MQPVLGLVENGLRIGLEGLLVDFFAAIGGQAVHDQRAGFGQLHQRGVDLVAGEFLDALGGFSLLAIETHTSV